jgi:hypothetical protein
MQTYIHMYSTEVKIETMPENNFRLRIGGLARNQVKKSRVYVSLNMTVQSGSSVLAMVKVGDTKTLNLPKRSK